MIDAPEQQAATYGTAQAYADGVTDAWIEVDDERITARLATYRTPALLHAYFKGRRERREGGLQ